MSIYLELTTARISINNSKANKTVVTTTGGDDLKVAARCHRIGGRQHHTFQRESLMWLLRLHSIRRRQLSSLLHIFLRFLHKCSNSPYRLGCNNTQLRCHNNNTMHHHQRRITISPLRCHSNSSSTICLPRVRLILRPNSVNHGREHLHPPHKKEVASSFDRHLLYHEVIVRLIETGLSTTPL